MVNRKIVILYTGGARTRAPFFKNLPDKLSMPAALDGFKPFKIINILLPVWSNFKLCSKFNSLKEDE